MQFYLLIATALMVGKSNLRFLSGELHHTGIWEHGSTHVRLFMAPRLRGKWTFGWLIYVPSRSPTRYRVQQ